MLRAMHKYKKSLFGFLLLGLVCMVMTGFGVNMFNRRQEPYAIKIDEHSIGYDHVSQERRALEERYRSVFGNNYSQMMNQLGINVSQQAVDKAINDHLLEREARSLNLAVGDESLGTLIKLSLFGKDRPFDPQVYRGFLRQVGMNSRQFEEQVRGDALRQQFAGIIHLASVPSKREVRAAIEHDEAKFSVEYVEFDPASYLKSIKDPDASVIEEYYKANGSRYELPPRISYDYVALDPEKFLDLVEVTPDDIELHYSDHQSDFITPEQVRARHVQLNFTKNASPAEMASLKAEAEQVHQKAVAGEPFESLVLQYSDDITSKGNGGDVGWIARGKMPKQFDAAAFAVKQGGIADLVQTDYGFHIIKVEGHKPAAPKELSEVRMEIDKLLRRQEAPAYTSERAHALFEKWQAGTMSLADFAVTNNLVAVSTNGLLDKDKDPENSLRGLTDKVMNFPDETKQMVDIGDKTVLVAVKQYRDQEVPPLDQVRAKVLQDWKKEQARLAAKGAAQTFVKSVEAAAADASLKSVAEANKLTAKESKDMSIAGRSRMSPFNNAELVAELFNFDVVGKKPNEVFEVDGKFIVARTTSAVKPEQSAVDAKITEYRQRGADSFLQTSLSAMVTTLKARSAIDIAPGLLEST